MTPDPSAGTAPSWREVLRASSKTAHAVLDHALEPAASSRGDYTRLIQVLHALHAEADPLLARWVGTSPVVRHLRAPDRERALAADLTALGAAPLAPIALGDLPTIAPGLLSDPAGIALLYVVAGSSLGARVILRRLPDSIPNTAREGLTRAASAQSAALWSDLIPLLARPAPPADAASARDVCSCLFARILERLDRVPATSG